MCNIQSLVALNTAIARLQKEIKTIKMDSQSLRDDIYSQNNTEILEIQNELGDLRITMNGKKYLMEIAHDAYGSNASTQLLATTATIKIEATWVTYVNRKKLKRRTYPLKAAKPAMR